MPTPSLIDEDFSGTFISQADPPSFSDLEDHPIHKFVNGTISVREHILLKSQKVEAIVFVSNRKLFSLYLPKLTFDSVCDPEETTPIITGALGSMCSKAVPVAIDAEDAFADSFVLVPFTPELLPHFLVGSAIPEDLFLHEDRPDAPLQKPSEDYSEFCIIRLPMVLPKVSGEPILEGALLDEHVQSSMMNYNPTAHAWVEVHKLLLASEASVLTPTKVASLATDLVPTSTASIRMRAVPTITPNILLDSSDPTSLHAQTHDLIRSKIASNIHHYKQDHPGVTLVATPTIPTLLPTAAPVTPPQALPTPTPAPSTTESFVFQGVSLAKKYERPLRTFQALLCSMDDTNKVTLPTFRPTFLQCFQQSSAQEASRFALMAMQQHDAERSANSRDYLLRQITPLHWNQTTVTLFLQALFHTAPFEENKLILKSKISFLTFLPHPPESQSPDLQKYLQDNHVEQMQILVGESNENKQKLSLHTFHGGMRKTISDVLSGIANLESRLSFVVDYTSSAPKPLLVDWLLQLANLFSSAEFRDFWDKYIPTHPWLAHAMSNQTYVLFALLAKSASNLQVLDHIKSTSTFPTSALQLPIKAFSAMINDIHIACSGTSPVSFATPPLSYIPPTTSAKRRLDVSPGTSSSPSAPTKRQSTGSPPNRGWIESTKHIMWPKELSGKQLCTRFAQLGSSCPNGRNCPYQHKLFPKDFSDPDIDIICKLVESSPHMKFGPHVTLPSRSSRYTKPTPSSKDVSFAKSTSSLKPSSHKHQSPAQTSH